MPPGTAQLIRVQGTYVSDSEIKLVLDFVKQQAEPEFDRSILEKQEPIGSGDIPGDDFDDELYDEAVEITLLSGQASASNLQRRLRIGYARAARLIDIMEEHGVIGPARGSKPREIYASKGENEYEEPEEENE
jgi:S-DNA-T family DNA segregation ATPase FtsK/SpoIIIE